MISKSIKGQIPEPLWDSVFGSLRAMEVTLSRKADDQLLLEARSLSALQKGAKRLEKFLSEISSSALKFDDILTHRGAGLRVSDPVRTLASRGLIRELSDGTYSLEGFCKRLLDRLDEEFLKLSEELGFRPVQVPSLIRTEDLRKIGQFSKIPPHVLSVANVGEPGRRRVTLPERCLTPACCYNIFKKYENATLSTKDLVLESSRCSCFRNELNGFTPLARQLEFQMRELVFLGAEEEVLNMRSRLMERVWALALEWDLTGKVVEAVDPFFVKDEALRAVFQLSRNLKYELRVPFSRKLDVAVASFNVHELAFGRGFNIRRGREYAFSGCVGFGLERWVLVLVARYGLRRWDWPKQFQNCFENNDK